MLLAGPPIPTSTKVHTSEYGDVRRVDYKYHDIPSNDQKLDCRNAVEDTGRFAVLGDEMADATTYRLYVAGTYSPVLAAKIRSFFTAVQEGIVAPMIGAANDANAKWNPFSFFFDAAGNALWTRIILAVVLGVLALAILPVLVQRAIGPA